MTLNKPLDEIREDDLQFLVDDKVAEKKTIEYKGAALPGNTDSEKKEFLADVSSFANAAGGLLIYGIKEDNGLPIDVCGIEIDDVDAAIRRLDNLMRDGISPRLPGPPPIQPVPIPSKSARHYALIIRIQRSWAQPHRVIYQDHGHFYSRNSAGKYRLEVSELRTAFELSGTTSERIRNFRTERISKIFSGEAPRVLEEKTPKLILHIVPFSAFDPETRFDVTSLVQHRQYIEPFMLPETSQYGSDTRYNFDGLLSWYPSSYVQFFRNGSVEALDTSILSASREARKISGVFLERRLREAIERYITAQKLLGIAPPLLIMVSLLGVKGFKLMFNPQRPSLDDTIDRSDLIIPETLLESFNFNITEVTSPIFDTIANAAGWERSMIIYDEFGQSSFRQ